MIQNFGSRSRAKLNDTPTYPIAFLQKFLMICPIQALKNCPEVTVGCLVVHGKIVSDFWHKLAYDLDYRYIFALSKIF